MADLNIYNNGEGKILFSAGDRIIRQPYDFGNCFQDNAGLNNYILIDGLNLEILNSTQLLWSSETPFYPLENSLATLKAGINNYNLIRSSGNGRFGVIKNSTNFPSSVVLTQLATPPNALFFGSNFRTTDGTVYVDGNSLDSNITNLTDTHISNIILGAAIGPQGTSIVPTAFRRVKINRFCFFSRSINIAERNYFYNNKIGSNLQSNQLLEIDITANFAEILNTGGSDFVGVRDFSGNNRHGKIMNLPAGTLQEQLDFANANLFVNYLS